MAKILETRLPVAIGELSPETFNRLVRVLELSLNKVDVDATYLLMKHKGIKINLQQEI